MSEDLKVICSVDCGNAPKKEIIRDFTIAVARNDIDFIGENVTDNIMWNIVGDKRFQGKNNFIEALGKMGDVKTIELRIDNVLTHGKDGSANGVLTFANNKLYAFCDVYTFSSSKKNARIKEITSYVIGLG